MKNPKLTSSTILAIVKITVSVLNESIFVAKENASEFDRVISTLGVWCKVSYIVGAESVRFEFNDAEIVEGVLKVLEERATILSV